MILEIHGAGFRNKGAELMLRTVVDELKRRLPEFEPAIDPDYGPYDSRCELGLRQVFPSRRHVSARHFLLRLARQQLLASSVGRGFFRFVGGGTLGTYGCVGLSEIQGFIDISGFAYTDQWGPRPTKNLAELTHYYRSRRKPVILLPQAFGPFGTDEIKSAFRKVLDNSSLVFARDRKSYEYAIELAAEPDKVLQAPDITLFYPRNLYESRQKPSDYVCVVPNSRMVDQGKEYWGDKYELYLVQVVQALLRQAIQVHIVVYDYTGQDLHIAKSICERVSSPDVVITNESDPVVLKRIISECLLVVGSRYHSLVTALSMRVPAIALGWAHKYESLLEDFGCDQFLISHDTTIEDMLEYLHRLLDKDVNKAYREQIAKRLADMALENQEMWERVVGTLTTH